MIDLYEIGITLTMGGELGQELDSTMDSFTALQGVIDHVNESLGLIAGRVGAISAAAGGMASSWDAAASAAERMAAAAERVAAGGHAVYPPPPGPAEAGGGGVPYPVPSSAPAEPAPASEPPQAPSSGVPAVIPGQPYYSGDDGQTFTRPNYQPNWQAGDDGQAAPSPAADEPFIKPGPIPLLSPEADPVHGHGLGLSDLFFGQAVLDMGGKIVAAGYNTVAEPQDQITRMRLADKNFSQADAAKAMAAAKDLVTNVPGMSLTGAVTLIAQGYQQTRNIDDAIAMATPMAKVSAVLNAAGDTAGVDQVFDLQRAAELAGTLNDRNPDGTVNITAFTNWVENAARVAESTPGVDPHQILLETQQDDVGAMSNDQEGQTYDDILISALGGYKAGSGLAALRREFTGGKMSTGTEHILEKLGLIDPRGATKNGQYYTLKPGALKEQDLFDRDPVKWLETTFTDAVNKMSPDDRNAMLHDIYSGTGTASGARVAGDAVLQDVFIARQMYYAEQDTQPVDTSMGIIADNPSTAAHSLGNSLLNLSNTLLNPTAPTIVDDENKVTKAINTTAAHPLKGLEEIAGDWLKFIIDPLAPVINSGASAGTAVRDDIADAFAKALKAAGNDIMAALQRLNLMVTVTNPDALAHGALEHLTEQYGLMPTGPNGVNYDLSPPLPGGGTFGGITP